MGPAHCHLCPGPHRQRPYSSRARAHALGCVQGRRPCPTPLPVSSPGALWGGSGGGQGQRSTNRRRGSDEQGKERAGGGVRGQGCDKALRRQRGKRGWAGATVAAAPTLVQAAAARVAPSGQRGAAGGGGEGGTPPPDSAVRGAGAHAAPALSPPGPEAWARHHLMAGDGVREGKVEAPGWAEGDRRGSQPPTQWRTVERVRAGWAEQRSSGGAPQPAGGRATE